VKIEEKDGKRKQGKGEAAEQSLIYLSSSPSLTTKTRSKRREAE
jgi:hypothetical protein